VTLRYEAVLDLATAAAEAGLPPPEFADACGLADPDAHPGSTAGARRHGPAQLFQETFVELARVLQSGQRKSPHRTNRSPATAVRRERWPSRPTGTHRHRRRGRHRACLGRGHWPGGAPAGGHREEVTALVFQQQRPLAAVGGRDRLLRLWEVEHGREARVLRGHTDAIRCVTISADGKRALSAAMTAAYSSGPDHWRAS